jgi:hypothetical protein
MTEPIRWPSLAYLDALRPDAEWSVKSAMLASYSADLVSIGAALLALAGLDNEAGKGSKTALAEAIERLRGKVRIVVQRGRVARPQKISSIAGVLDQFIFEVAFDERERSWHPKAALVQFEHPKAGVQWRLWLGSRNLTVTENRDIGLLLVSAGADSRGAMPISGVGQLAERLATHAQLGGTKPSRLRMELDLCQWMQPAKMRVEKIELTASNAPHDLPSPSEKLDEVFVVSPFLDGSIVGRTGRWGDAKTKRYLLSTLPELAKIARQVAKPLTGFEHVSFLEPSSAEPTDPSIGADDGDTRTTNGELEYVRPGLHAKIIAVRKSKELRLWIGSANATQRAWGGKNVEVIAEIVAESSVGDALRELINQQKIVSPESLAEMDIQEVDSAAERLESARKRMVAEWKGEIKRSGNVFVLRCTEPPHPEDVDIELEAGLATGGRVGWPRGEKTLPLGSVPSGLQTELVQLQLGLGAAHCTWLQRVPVTPAFDAGRDHAAFAKYLGTNQFLDWIAALLNGETEFEQSDASWDQAEPSVKDGATTWLDPVSLSLESMLACWSRDSNAFGRVDARLKSYLDPIIAQAEAESPQDLERLREFQAVWRTVGSTLLKGH